MFAIAIGRTPVRALDGLYFVMCKLFVQDAIHYDPQVKTEDDDEAADAMTIMGDDEMDGTFSKS